jgi:integrase
MRQEIISYDPTRAVDKVVREIARDRVLTDRELILFWNACEAIGWPWGPLGKLLLLTAQRRGEVAGATWGELDLEKRLWTIPRERAKNDRAHQVYLGDLALEVLDTVPRITSDPDYLFSTTGHSHVSGYSKARSAIDGHMAAAAGEPIPYWKFHDLSRSAASGTRSCRRTRPTRRTESGSPRPTGSPEAPRRRSRVPRKRP